MNEKLVAAWKTNAHLTPYHVRPVDNFNRTAFGIKHEMRAEKEIAPSCYDVLDGRTE